MICEDSRLRAMFAAAAIGASLLAAGCSGEPEDPAATACEPGGPGTLDPGPCDPDPLRTDLPPLWNGNSVDAYDCPTVEFAAKYDEPDAMVFKAMLYVESRFQYDAVGCTDNGPCCPEIGWTAAECACLGMMQNGPECGATSGLGLRSDGHPNMETNPDCAAFTNSVFNPVVNIEIGISRVSSNRARMMENFPGCTEDQYTMMAVGEYQRYRSTQSCSAYNFDYDSAVLEAYDEYSAAAGWPAHPYVAQ
ncbi:MAG: hypothetical protein JW940_22025 [Polyangiaceae bacterium]|nr:hypothetical protein [Polyangiaceae bacterium]